MGLNVSRRIISRILQIIIAISTIAFMVSIIMTFTVADQNFFINQFSSQKFANQCDDQLNMKYEALASETGIPARVYERVEDDFPTDEALRQAALSVFSEENETLYSENKIDYFYELSVEYLDGNEKSYNKEDIMRSSEKAARIYSDVVGLHNTGSIEARLTRFSQVFPRITIASFLVAFVCFPSLLIMYKQKKKGYFNAIGGVFAGAVATIIGSALLMLFNIGGSIDILPEIHKKAMVMTTVKDLFILIFFSLILAVVSLSAMRVIDVRNPDED